jgi:hypothetical protein
MEEFWIFRRLKHDNRKRRIERDPCLAAFVGFGTPPPAVAKIAVASIRSLLNQCFCINRLNNSFVVTFNYASVTAIKAFTYCYNYAHINSWFISFSLVQYSALRDVAR